MVPAEAHYVLSCADDNSRACYEWRDPELVRRALQEGGGQSFLPPGLGGPVPTQA